jgi:O-antigen ligase
VLYWLIASTLSTVGRLRVFCWTLLVISVPLAATGVKNYLTGTHIARADRIAGYEAPLTGNPNDLALMLNLLIPFGLALAASSRSRIVKGAAFGIVLLDVTGVILTFSRGGFLTLGAIVMGTVVGLLRSAKAAYAVALVALLIASLPLLPGPLWDRLSTIVNIEADATGSAQARRDLLIAATKYVVTHPVIGTGIGMGVLGLREQGGESWNHVHNAYLQFALELGLLGLLLFLVLLRRSFKAASRARHLVGTGHDARTTKHLGQATRLSLIAFAVAAVFHPIAYNFYFYVVAGLAAALAAQAALFEKQPESPADKQLKPVRLKGY